MLYDFLAYIHLYGLLLIAVIEETIITIGKVSSETTSGHEILDQRVFSRHLFRQPPDSACPVMVTVLTPTSSLIARPAICWNNNHHCRGKCLRTTAQLSLQYSCTPNIKFAIFGNLYSLPALAIRHVALLSPLLLRSVCHRTREPQR